MAVRKAGSRRIVVDGTPYCWRIRHRATNLQTDYGCGCLHVAIALAERNGTVLVLFTDRPLPSDWGTAQVAAMTPSDIAKWIRLACNTGWIPSNLGPLVCMVATDVSVRPIA